MERKEFVRLCLETLEELDMRAQERFIAAGGKAFLRVPALNDHPLWVAAAAAVIDMTAAGISPMKITSSQGKSALI